MWLLVGVKSQTLLIQLEFDATIEEDAKFQLELVKMKMHFVDLVWVFFLSIQVQSLWPNWRMKGQFGG